MNAIDILQAEQPKFQVRSGTQEMRSTENFFSAGPKDTATLERASHPASKSLLNFLAEEVTSSDFTIETGGGWSTVVFASAAKGHVCVNPDRSANDLILEFLRAHNLPADALSFVHDCSDIGLPGYEPAQNYDIALIDGNHSYPYPTIDWHYIDKHLAKGGRLLVDDSYIKSVAVLCEFLAQEKDYEFLRTVGHTAVFAKRVEARGCAWGSQLMNQEPEGGRKPFAPDEGSLAG